MPESPIHQREHAVGEVVLFKKLCAVHLSFQKGIKIKNSGSAISSVNGLAWFAENVKCHS